MEAVAASQHAVPVPRARRGEQLFVAKGCNSCHAHGQIGRQPLVPLGSDLTDKRYSDVLLSMLLADPSFLPPTGGFGMPNLNLRPREIEALVAFINKSTTHP
jgi:mono/diheme cytochrome c family protein